MRSKAVQIAITCINATEQCIVELFDWMANQYQQMLARSGDDVDSSKSDWNFISSAVNDIFQELQLLWTGGQIHPHPGVQGRAMISTIELQEELTDDFNMHNLLLTNCTSMFRKMEY